MNEKVAVQGLGFVGAVMSLVIAESDNDYEVYGIDLPSKQDIIEKLNRGIFPITSSDEKVIEYYKKVRQKGNFKATSNPKYFAEADIIIVDVNLDIDKSIYWDNPKYAVNMNCFKDAIKSFAKICKEDVLIIVETTVPPGTCQQIVKPILIEEFSKRGLKNNFKIGHSYERVMPGPGYIDSIKNYYRVYSGINKESADATEKFLKTIISTKRFPLTRLSSTNASEMAKVLENSYRAMNIAFIQEWAEFSENSGVNLNEVLKSIRLRKTHNNIMSPGLGVGGYCLTKDSLLASWASQFMFNSNKLKQSEKAIRINDRMPQHSFKLLKNHFKELDGITILLLGVSYLKNIGDTRYSPCELLYKKFTDKKAKVHYFDPFIPKWSETGLQSLEDKDLFEKNFDAIIIGSPHDILFENEYLTKTIKNKKRIFILDPFSSITEKILNENNNHIFKFIGRGDV